MSPRRRLYFEPGEQGTEHGSFWSIPGISTRHGMPEAYAQGQHLTLTVTVGNCRHGMILPMGDGRA